MGTTSYNRARASRIRRLDDRARLLARRPSHRVPGGHRPARGPVLLGPGGTLGAHTDGGYPPVPDGDNSSYERRQQ